MCLHGSKNMVIINYTVNVLTAFYLLITRTNSWICCTNNFNCDADPIHCVGDTLLCDERDGHCLVQCEATIHSPLTNTCSTNEAGCCQSEIFCPV